MVSLSPAWKTLILNQLKANIALQGPTATYASLSTVRADNTPANRTVVLRGFAGESHEEETGWESDLLTITCDKRSAKMEQLLNNPNVEINWFMCGTKEQFRLRGRLFPYGHGIGPEPSLDRHIAPKAQAKKVTDGEDEDNLADKLSQASKSFLKRIKSRLHRHKKTKEEEVEEEFDWEAERLRQWHALGDELRATFSWPKSCEALNTTTERVSKLAIHTTDDKGWFVNDDPEHQALLERAYENFVVLFLEVDEMDHLVLETGERTLYKDQETIRLNA
ncbi:hypothetical protein EC973_000585 [Apophysomyces ossiformis]|uniref:Pyridoxamine 5'-phosphate oxidase Alr4036 family FMN-binding domain-containing protein n=1 Tax=Apophysomyces ossiformis TaxID=679940 RepID=A0A8H7BKM8_9FUNG|nr:hypothetical protein EC973_000585 [Apophysomyces ossiformis]